MDTKRTDRSTRPLSALLQSRPLSTFDLTSRPRWLLRRPLRAWAAVVLILAFLLVWRSGGVSHVCSCMSSTEPSHHMPKDTTNSFETFKWFGPTCNISTSDLYEATDKPCLNRQLLLEAMSSGGRIGKDAPYIPRGCGYVWYSTQEICEVLGRFSQVVLVGDSMLRHVIGAINVLIREDLGYGGVTDWNLSAVEREQCFCNRQFDVHDCSVQGIFSTHDVIKNDPSSLQCLRTQPGWATTIQIEQMVHYPMPEVELSRLRSTLDAKMSRPRAFILGHGLWNNLNHGESLAWLDTVLDVIRPSLQTSDAAGKRGRRNHLPVLLMTPNAAGESKPDQWLVSQGNKALVLFEKWMAEEAGRRGIDHLGTWNMSVQASLYDGVHMDMRGNLVKAMMVLNWLDSL